MQSTQTSDSFVYSKQSERDDLSFDTSESGELTHTLSFYRRQNAEVIFKTGNSLILLFDLLHCYMLFSDR